MLIDSEMAVGRRGSRFGYLLRRVFGGGRDEADSGEAEDLAGRPRALRWKHRWAAWTWRPRVLDDMPVLLFASEHTLRDYTGEALGWDRVVGDLTVFRVHAEHNDIVREPTVGEVADVVLRHLKLPSA